MHKRLVWMFPLAALLIFVCLNLWLIKDAVIIPRVLAQQSLYTNGILAALGYNVCGAVGGSANAVTCSVQNWVGTFAYQDGAQYAFKPTAANTASATLAIGGAAAKTVKLRGGAANLVSGDWCATGQWVIVSYDVTNDVFIMQSPSCNAASGGTPGGSTTQVQYNNAAAFGGIANATSDGTQLTLSTWATDFTQLHLLETFCANLATQGFMGTNGWTYAGNGTVVSDQSTNANITDPCLITVQTTTTAGNLSVLMANPTTATRIFGPWATIANATTAFKFTTPANITNISLRIGFGATPQTDTDTNTVVVRYNSAASGCAVAGSDTTWIYQTSDGTAATGGTVAIATNTEYTLKIAIVAAGTINFSMSTAGGAFSTPVALTTHIPTNALSPMFQVVNCASTQRNLLARRWAWDQTGLQR